MADQGTAREAASTMDVSASEQGVVTADSLIESLDRLTHETQLQLGPVTQSLFFVGDGLQRAVIDKSFDLLQPGTWTPFNLLRSLSRWVDQSLQVSRLWITGEGRRRTLQEIANKLEVFVLVKNLASIMNLPPGEFIPAEELITKAYAMGAFPALWAVEGVGHYYADSYWRLRGYPDGLLLESAVPEKSLLMLHAGMGLAFADRLLGNLTSEASESEIRSAVEEFIELCRRNSRTGYLGAAIESLGLVTRDFYPDLLKSVDQQLRSTAEELTGFFWHGVGRALYFSREYFLPVLCTVWSGIEVEVPEGRDRLNAIAGLAWAITLVNMRQPGIMEGALQSYVSSGMESAFSNGVSSAVMMRSDTTPGEPFVSAFYRHRIDPEKTHLAGVWQTHVMQPSLQALQHDYEMLRERRHLDQIFQYREPL